MKLQERESFAANLNDRHVGIAIFLHKLGVERLTVGSNDRDVVMIDQTMEGSDDQAVLGNEKTASLDFSRRGGARYTIRTTARSGCSMVDAL